MTGQERRILSPLASNLRREYSEVWWELKCQTQYGPEFPEFPYFPAALEFSGPAQEAIAGLNARKKTSLLEAWRSKPRYPCDFGDDDQRILKQYAVILVDLVVKRAKQAGCRSW